MTSMYAQWALVLRGNKIRLVHDNQLRETDIDFRWAFSKDVVEISNLLQDAYYEILEDEEAFGEDTHKIKEAIKKQFPEATL